MNAFQKTKAGNSMKIDINNMTKMEKTKLDNFSNFDMFSPPNLGNENSNIKDEFNKAKNAEKNINYFNKQTPHTSRQQQINPNTERKFVCKQNYYSNQENSNYTTLLTGKIGDNEQNSKEDLESFRFYEQKLTHLKKDSDSKETNSKSLNYNLIGKGHRSTESSGQKRKETLENIKDYLGKIEQTKNKEEQTFNHAHQTSYKNIDAENKRLKLNENSKKYILDKMHELNSKNVISHRETNKVYPSANINTKNSNFSKK